MASVQDAIWRVEASCNDANNLRPDRSILSLILHCVQSKINEPQAGCNPQAALTSMRTSRKVHIMAGSQPIPTSPKFQDLTGQTFGRLVVLSFTGSNRHRKYSWLCRCECGRESIIAGTHLRNGHTVSCGKCLSAISMLYQNKWLMDKLKDSTALSESGCWEWTRTRNQGGYGEMSIRRKLRHASHISYSVFIGEIPAGLMVLHKCDNPPCINPDHLFLGTQQDNMDDMAAKGRARHVTGQSHGRAKLTWDDVAAMRELYDAGGTMISTIARQFGVGHTTACDVVHRRTWTD